MLINSTVYQKSSNTCERQNAFIADNTSSNQNEIQYLSSKGLPVFTAYSLSCHPS